MKRFFWLFAGVIGFALMSACGGGNSTPPPPPVTITVTPTALPYGVAQQTYPGAQFAASGGTAPYTFTSSNLPAGMTLSSDGKLTGTTPSGGGIDYPFVVTARDSAGHSGFATASFHAYSQLSATLPFKETTSSSAYPGGIAVPMPESNVSVGATIAGGALPSGLTLSNAKIQGPNPSIPITGTPTQSGIFNFTVELTDSLTPPRTAQVPLKMFVDVRELRFLTTSLADGRKGDAYTYNIAMTGGTFPINCALAPGSSAMPQGITVGAGCIATGTPTESGTFSFTIRATDSGAQQQTADQAFTMRVVDPIKLSTNLPDATTGEAYQAAITFSGGTPPYTSTGMSMYNCPFYLDGTDFTLRGVPYVPAPCNINIYLHDSVGQYASLSFTVNVKEGVFQIGPNGLPRGKQGKFYNARLSAVGGTRPLHWNVVGTLPAGITTAPDGDRIRFTGTPTAAGDYPLTLQVTDSAVTPKVINVPMTLSVYATLPRNESVPTAGFMDETYSSVQSQISPYADPVDLSNPDQDYYHLRAFAGEVLFLDTNQATNYRQFDPVMEIVNSNGQRFNTCRSPNNDFPDPDGNVDLTPTAFDDECMDDDLVPGENTNSHLEFVVPGASGTLVDLYVHIVDFRGDARPDFRYFFNFSRYSDRLF